MKILINLKETQWSREALLGALALCVCVCEGCIKWHLKEKWPELLDAHYQCHVPGRSVCLQLWLKI